MPDRLKPINIIGASAGTGKTFRLASEFGKSLAGNSGAGCPTEIIATTFTNKAADELTHRIRKFLLKDGHWNQAQELFASFVGTVNSVCGRLVSDLAIEGGLSPSIKIIAEDRQQEVFTMAVEEVTNSYASELWTVIFRLGKEDDWRSDVIAITYLARQNNINPEILISFAESSWLSFQKLLPVPSEDKILIDQSLKNELNVALSNLPAPGDNTKVTAEAIDLLREIDRTWEAMSELPWHTWIKLSKLKTSKQSQPIVSKLTQMARDHALQPAFQQDIKTFIHGVFACAADCLNVYRDFKAERGLLDFIDQEQIALSLLQQGTVQDVLGNRFSTLLVDEFQDTSPIQLAVFLELARIVKSSIWVGDKKQSIFGFRGADPLLMHEVVESLVPATGGQRDNLTESYRSRPALVNLVNKVFVSAMQPLGISMDDVEIRNVARPESTEMNAPIHVWWLGGSNQSLSTQSLAQGVLQILCNPQSWVVGTGVGNQTRPLRGSDIAILCRSNDHRLDIANSLSKLGVMVSTERTGLLNNPECVLSVAVLRYLADRYDTLAMAEIVRYTNASEDEKQWLFDWLERGPDEIRTSNEVVVYLDSLRDQLLGLTPLESLQVATATPLIRETILRWGNHRQRMLNLEALSGIANSYEEFCSTNRQTASVGGLVTFLTFNNKDALQPPNPDEQAVHVLTYHKAKGLEWPLVIMYDLDAPPPAIPFGIHVPKRDDGFDPLEPLAGRAIRYWPWPYGLQRSNIDLATAALNTTEMIEASAQRHAECLRLLYVGMTRPRDYLILACRDTGTGADWLHMAMDERGETIFQLSSSNLGTQCILRHASEVSALCAALSPPSQLGARLLDSSEERYQHAVPPSISSTHLPYSCIPSGLRLSEDTPADSIVINKKINLGGRLTLADGADFRLVGDAMHLFLATDDYESNANERLLAAARIADAYKVFELNPLQFVEASTRLREKLDELYPDARWLREWPVTGRYGTQRIAGAIDLLLELSEGFVIVDHKSFPGPRDSWEDRAISHYPQLDAYASLVSQATTKKVVAMFIHMPIVGTLLSLTSVREWTSSQSPPPIEDNWLVF